ncbi:hypothetical protein [Actinacidiphila rubida]|uniref:Uncharacterized protein n=1 Tax=Actinacidiphila rubida TaxID=310780 RepID=A0A1H8T0Z7_9ACTN|nr:hypothetical protein [Actinacidiphila rubida]SEO84163.1 hypothetical protein SAMN05216267_104690 [Actinacidiphila rubida]
MAKCAHCQQEIPPGKGKTVSVEQGTGMSPDLHLHANPDDCAPVTWTRTYQPSRR